MKICLDLEEVKDLGWVVCTRCCGSGEGWHADQRCTRCGGAGVEPSELIEEGPYPMEERND